MSENGAILVLHGITMSGASVSRTLGPLRTSLEDSGFELLAPNAAHRMSQRELAELEDFLERRYRKHGQTMSDWFCDGRFWDAGEHYDWFESTTDPASGLKTYASLERSLDVLARAVDGKRLRGVVGFSQGAAMAIVLAARALDGDARFAGLGFGVFISGFLPVFHRPHGVRYPISGRFRSLFALGEHDPLFPGTHEHLASLSEAFEDSARELVFVPDFGHDVPTAPRIVEHIRRFAARD